MSISETELQQYRETRRKRDLAAQTWQENTRQQLRSDARRVAEVLKNEFGATRVVLFGSIATDEPLSPRSDRDLATEGLPSADYYRAVARVQSVPVEASVDLVRLESCRPSLRDRIRKTGTVL